VTATIRFAGVDDGAALAAIYAPGVVERATSFEFEPPDAAEMARRVAVVQQRTPWLVYEVGGDVLGYAYASAHRERLAYQWSVDVSAYVADAAHRRGVARGLYAVLLDLLVLQGFVNAYAGITLPNAASEGFHAAMGFRPVGVYRGVGWKLGRWHDVVWLERELAPRGAEPKPPTPLPLLRDTAPVAALLRGGRPVR
jgi:phosphinothricin acetyltransferase